MPDGSTHAPASVAAPLSTPEGYEPALADALARLLACAGRGLPADGVLRDMRALLIARGLLLPAGPDGIAEAVQGPSDPPPRDTLDRDTLDGAPRS